MILAASKITVKEHLGVLWNSFREWFLLLPKLALYFLVLVIILAGMSQFGLGLTYYLDDVGGDNANDGTSVSTAWKSSYKLQNSFSAGDIILFKRGGVWRTYSSQIIMSSSGTKESPIIIGDYGSGNKPLLLGSVNISGSNNWHEIDTNIWSYGGLPEGNLTELLPNPSFTANLNNYTVSTSGNVVVVSSRSTTVYHTSPGSWSLNFTLTNHSSTNNIQVYPKNFDIEGGTYYVFSFWAKSNTTFNYTTISLMEGSSPFTLRYNQQAFMDDKTINNTWKEFKVYFLSSLNQTNANVRFYLGLQIPNATELWFDDFSMQKSSTQELVSYDVGNIIFDSSTFGLKNWSYGALLNQNEYFYNATNWSVYVYSTSNPGSIYSSIEASVYPKNIDINSKDNYIIENLSIKYGGQIGISMSTKSENITLRYNDFSYIGGSQHSGTTRFGNAIQLWNDGGNILIENNTLDNIYDAALTNQGSGATSVYNITYRNNVVKNSEYCFEYWAKTPGTVGTLSDVKFENNTCINMGDSWASSQRPDPNGYCFMFFASNITNSNLNVRNNVCYNSTKGLIFLNPTWWGLSNLSFDYNLFFKGDGRGEIFWNNSRFFKSNFTSNTSKGNYTIFTDRVFYEYMHNETFFNNLSTNFSTNKTILEYYSVQKLNDSLKNILSMNTFGYGNFSLSHSSGHIIVVRSNTSGWWNQSINGKTINLPPNGLYAYIVNDSSFEECFNCDNTSTWVITPSYIYLYPKNDASITFNLPSSTQEYTIKRFYGDDSENGLRLINSVRASTYTTSNAEILYPVNVALPLCLYSIGGSEGTTGMSSLFGALALVIVIVFIVLLITKKVELGSSQSWLFVGGIVLFLISMVIFSVLVNVCA